MKKILTIIILTLFSYVMFLIQKIIRYKFLKKEILIGAEAKKELVNDSSIQLSKKT